ncbi:DUF4384 domain-containing protein [Candidatus Halocynthiibacter alkanivorans]|uniref:DUF4384 domain-containing protein n=1 Tax=Candidatus Halocynthiibacter alkanivorans TaxID=2267619 RepID=UPI000DF259DA|nr:DUF4384 domain-containing protein [Candidatus Halocynthiibacter alkanivorans]
MTLAPRIWLSAAGVSVAVHVAGFFLLPLSVTPEPVPDQEMPESRLDISAYPVEQSQAQVAEPEVESSQPGELRPATAAQYGVPQSRSEALSPDAETLNASAAPAEQTSVTPPSGTRLSNRPAAAEALTASAAPLENLTASRARPQVLTATAATGADGQAALSLEAEEALASPLPGGAQLRDSAMQSERLSEGAMLPERLNDSAVQPERLADSAVQPERLMDSTVQPERLADSAVQPEMLMDSTVQTERLMESAAQPERLASQASRADALMAEQVAPEALMAAAARAERLAAAAVPRRTAAPAALNASALPAATQSGSRLDSRAPAAEPARRQDASGVAATNSAAAVTARLSDLPPPSERGRATLAWSGEDGTVDPVSLAAIQSFMRPGDLAGSESNAGSVRDGIAAFLQSVPCARIQAAFIPETGSLELRGHIPENGLRGPVLSALQEQIGDAIPVTDNLLILPRPQCGALSGIAGVGLPQSTDQDSDERLVGPDAHARAYDYSEGQRLSFDLSAPDYDAYLYVDYFDAEGQVLHLVPNEIVGLEKLDAKTTIGIGKERVGFPSLSITVGPPFGQEIAVAFAASTPLYDGLRPIREPAEPYLTFLKDRVARARALDSEFKGEWVYFFITTAPAPLN